MIVCGCTAEAEAETEGDRRQRQRRRRKPGDGEGGGGGDRGRDVAFRSGRWWCTGAERVGGAHPGEMALWEPELAQVCRRAYDVVVLAFVTSFVQQRMPTDFPRPASRTTARRREMRTTRSCSAVTTSRPASRPVMRAASRCCCRSAARPAATACQRAQAEGFAQTVWDLFMGGSSVRPFGDARSAASISTSGQLDDRVRRVRRPAARVGRRLVYVPGAPQCPYPDAYLGPAPGRALGDHPELFDALFGSTATTAAATPEAFRTRGPPGPGCMPAVAASWSLPATLEAASRPATSAGRRSRRCSTR
jgi:hypothetical protein